MSTQIDTAFIRDFKEGITMLAQQRMTRMRPAVRVEMVKGDRAHFDQTGSVTAQPVTARHADTPLFDTPHSRRQVTLTPYKHADLIDDADKIRTLNDPTNQYVKTFASAFGRRMDQVIIDSAFATASTDVDGSGTAPFDTTNFTILHNSEGMTIAKMMEAKEMLDAAENFPEENYFCVMTARQIRDLITEQPGTPTGVYTVASADYTEQKALMTGDIMKFAGFNIIRSELLNFGAASIRRCIAWAQSSLLLGIGENPNGRMSERPDKNYSMQVFYSMDIGATRMDETGVVEIQCDES